MVMNILLIGIKINMEFLKDIFEYKNNSVVSGLTSELNVFYVLNYFETKKEDVLVVTNSLYEATKLYNQFQAYTKNVLLFPMDDFLTSVAVAESPDLKFTRLETLNKLENSTNIIITNLMGYLKFLSAKEEKNELNLKMNLNISRKELMDTLDKFGYSRESLVTSTGEYAVRGLVIDIFPIHETKPVRVEFDGNIIEGIKFFDENTQRTNNSLDEIIINPVSEIKTEVKNSILDYLRDKNLFLFDESQINAGYFKIQEEMFEYKNHKNITDKLMFDIEEIKPEFKIVINTIDSSMNDVFYKASELTNYNENFDKLLIDYNFWKKSNKEVYFYLTLDNQISKIKEIINDAVIVNKPLNKGFSISNYVLISANDIGKTVHETVNYKSSYKFGKKIKSYDQLEIGDFVVHVTHGVGVYNGIVKLNKGDVEKDFLQILYAGEDKIYVPASKITTIFKYGDKDGSNPKINKLNSDTWKKTKKYIESKIKDISLELMDLYKKRLEAKTEAYEQFEHEKEFDKSFDYTLTSNQIRSVDEIIKDLTSSYPMDRLLCGDVGFGKTEVAFRGVFNAVLNNKQVMFLCPTTILSSQQYKVAMKRFASWPLEIALLNRFVSVKEAKNIINRFNEGKIDILFGTHKILSDEIKPKNLGLLVIDEEQRFGVVHKEKIKKYKNDVNILTLSATPIPRTLKMALSGIRDLSVIDTPPVNRYPVQTYVLSENDLILKDAIYKELSRKGQIFILYNKVEDIESKVSYIKRLVPDAKINYAHGQMNKTELENIMNDFINYKYDILVCTTIIESGIDIPNVNTLIVYDADHFGLSQLYQIRGRVGRSNKIGYAYLLYKEGKVLNEVASKRLKAIKEFTELGSGYKIAMRDLAIRGAGDVFGSSQAGFVDSVGISLYLKMMDNEIKRQKGEEVCEEEDITTLLDVNTHINDNYVEDEDIKIEIHTLINKIEDEKSFEDVKFELENRFGKLPEDIIIYMYQEWFESLAQKLNIKNVKQTDRLIEVVIPKEISDNVKGDKLLINAFQINTNFNIKYLSGQIVISLLIKKSAEESFVISLIKLLNSILTEMNN